MKVRCLTPWDHQTERIYDTEDAAFPSVFANSGGGRTGRRFSSAMPLRKSSTKAGRDTGRRTCRAFASAENVQAIRPGW